MSAEKLRCVPLTICFVLANLAFGFAQGAATPLTVGPLTVTVPAGWGGQGNNPVQIYSPDSNLQQFLRVEIFAPQETQQDVRAQHALMMQRMSGVIPPGSQRQDGVSGQFIWTRYVIQLSGNQPEAAIWYSAKRGSQYIAITVEANQPELLTRHLAEIEAMVRGARFSDAPSAPAAAAPPANAGNVAGPQSNATGQNTLSDYVFTTPAGWSTTPKPGELVLMSPVFGSERCIIDMLPMRPASANLLTDAYSIFQDVFKDYQLTNQTPSGFQMPQSDVHGTSGQGWDYVIVKRGIAPRGSRESRLAFVFVAKLNGRLGVIWGLSKEPLVSACMGELQNNVWPRFFYSLSFKGWTAGDQGAEMRRRIAGVWTAATATAATRFTFAANGRYAGASAAQQYSNISNTELLTTTQAYFGDGAYTLRGNSITLTPDNQKNRPEPGFIRVEEESKDGGRTWEQALYLLRTSTIDGKEYEVRFLKK